MKIWIPFVLLFFVFASCGDGNESSSIDPVNWSKRSVKYPLGDTVNKGTTYLSVYSQIYSKSEHREHNLTATISIRNINRSDSVFIDKAEYFNTEGHLVRTYFDKRIYVAPMETVEIIIDEKDKDGGTGGNFLFDWTIRPGTDEPFFEGIMISTSGQQGLSFTTHGRKLK